MLEQKGGEYIAEGAYGCTFKPHLMCLSGESYKDGIGKIFSSEKSYQEEMDTHKIMKKIDPKNEFTVPMYSACVTDLNQARGRDFVELCSLANKREEPIVKQIIYKYGGIDLSRIVNTWNTAFKHLYFDDLLYMLPPLLSGIINMVKKGYVHCDIKPANILYNDDLKKLYLIDFGLVTEYKNIKSDQGILIHPYPYYPPEFKFLHAKQKGRRLTEDQIRMIILRNIDPDFMLKYKNYGYNMEDATKFFSRDNLNNFDNWAKTIDSYGLGMSMAIIYFMLSTRKYRKYKNKEFVKKVLGHVIIPMINLNPSKRMDAQTAYKILTDLIERYPKTDVSRTNTWLSRALSKFYSVGLTAPTRPSLPAKE
jgi:serine/threonine protein kinase